MKVGISSGKDHLTEGPLSLDLSFCVFSNRFLAKLRLHTQQCCVLWADDKKDLSKKATVITYSAAISACEKGSQWQRALMLLGEMDKKQAGDGQS